MRHVTQITKVNGVVISDPNEIGTIASDDFLALFSASPYHLDSKLFEEIQPTITDTSDEDFSC